MYVTTTHPDHQKADSRIIAEPMLPFFVAGAVVLYAINAGAGAMMNSMQSDINRLELHTDNRQPTSSRTILETHTPRRPRQKLNRKVIKGVDGIAAVRNILDMNSAKELYKKPIL